MSYPQESTEVNVYELFNDATAHLYDQNSIEGLRMVVPLITDPIIAHNIGYDVYEKLNDLSAIDEIEVSDTAQAYQQTDDPERVILRDASKLALGGVLDIIGDMEKKHEKLAPKDYADAIEVSDLHDTDSLTDATAAATVEYLMRASRGTEIMPSSTPVSCATQIDKPTDKTVPVVDREVYRLYSALTKGSKERQKPRISDAEVAHDLAKLVRSKLNIAIQLYTPEPKTEVVDLSTYEPGAAAHMAHNRKRELLKKITQISYQVEFEHSTKLLKDYSNVIENVVEAKNRFPQSNDETSMPYGPDHHAQIIALKAVS